MGKMIRTGVVMTVVLTILVGVIYPFAMTGLSQALFHDQANGSLLKVNGQVVGSSLIGQSFTKPQYFHPRNSAAGAGYDAGNSGGTNLGPTSTFLLTNTVKLAAAIRAENGLPSNYVLPADAVSTSASGLDPDISPAYADLQVARVARARRLTQARVFVLVRQYTSGRDLGVLGEPRVNVLELNLALDRITPR
ncbi:MAG TPA: potassium-transporting ATPase subunit KdpC [Chloroflexota bacterium]|nr:potassium-transporting ATPase subunit KdpC [Chloroflexota bacterium]